jgi:hypothetical protein
VFTIRHSRLKILVFYWLAVKMSLYALALILRLDGAPQMA